MIYLSTYLFIDLLFYLFIYLFIYLLNDLLIYRFIYLIIDLLTCQTEQLAGLECSYATP